MGDLHFRCLGCQQSLVADESGAGVSFNCPHCNTTQTIPNPPPSVSVQTPLEEEEPAAGLHPQASSDGGLWLAQERLWKNEHQSAEQAVALIERDQRISALLAQCDWLAAELEEERQRRQTLEPELDAAREAWAGAEKRAGDFEADYNHAFVRAQRAELAVEELSRQLELVKTERTEAVIELVQRQENFAELNLQLDKARVERTEMEKILGRARADLERTSGELAAAESVAEQAAAEAGRLEASNAHLRAELGLAVAERDKLQGLVREDHELADYVEAKLERERAEAEMKETQARADGLRERIEALMGEREALKRERKELQLRVAALRDAHDDTQLQQDNEVLRRMVERLNEELKAAQPEIAKRRRHAQSGGMVAGLARAALARCFVPDPDVVEGR